MGCSFNTKLAAKSDLVSLKDEVHKLDVDKLVPVLVDLSKLSDVVRNNVVKEIVYDKLVAKVNNIDTSGFVLKTKYNTDKSDLAKKIPDTIELVKKLDYSTNFTEIEDKIPSISGLATNAALTAVENNIHDISSLVEKYYNTKISETEMKVNDHNDDNWITTPDFNKVTAQDFMQY